MKRARHRTYAERCRNKKQHHAGVVVFFLFGAVLSFVAGVPGLSLLALAIIAWEVFDSFKSPQKSPVRKPPTSGG